MFKLYVFVLLGLPTLLLAQNPSILKQNQVQFSSGTVISDLKPDDLAIEVPQSVDFNTYMSYLFSQQVVVPGTINVSVGPSRKMITGRYYGLILTPSINYFQGIRGLSSANVKLGADLDPANPNAWSHVQVGTSNYGSSIWMRLHEDHDAMEISAYRNIQRDSLEPMNPQRLGIQLKPNGNSDVAINNKFYIDNGQVGIGTSHPSAPLEVVGNVNLGDHKLLGKVGEIRAFTASDVNYSAPGGGNPSPSLNRAAATQLAEFNLLTGSLTNPPFPETLKVLAVGSASHYLFNYQAGTTSFLRITDLTLGQQVAESGHLMFDYQGFANSEMTFNHFLVFTATANNQYRFEIFGQKVAGSSSSQANLFTTSYDGTRNERYSNLRLFLYAIPAE